MRRGWMISATENVNSLPNHADIAKLITKAWEKPMKIIKFYEYIKQRNINDNTIVALKALTTFQHYLLRGPTDVVQPYRHESLPIDLLAQLHAVWDDIRKEKKTSSSVIGKRFE